MRRNRKRNRPKRAKSKTTTLFHLKRRVRKLKKSFRRWEESPTGRASSRAKFLWQFISKVAGLAVEMIEVLNAGPEK